MNKLDNPHRFVNIWRLLNLLALTHLWLLSNQGLVGFVFIILLGLMVSLRYRFVLPDWSLGFDIVICIFYLTIDPAYALGLSLPLFEASLKGKGIYMLLPIALIIVLMAEFTGLLFWFLLLAILFGYLSYYFIGNRQQYLLEADIERKARYELEHVKADLLEAYHEVAQAAEIKERNRISRELHDHLGHDLTGAFLALQAAEKAKNEDQAKLMLQQVKERLERSTSRLRETVHNMAPVTLLGIERLERIVKEAKPLVVSFSYRGNTERTPIHAWILLEACLKEALTNVARHSNATKTKVELDVTDKLVRLRIQDNGNNEPFNSNGSGIRSLQIRARTLNGSLTVNRSQGYLLVCVLPIEGRI
ncbi:sensor histidine kinase [Alkalihalobacillus trypoxylicola]|uniref:histidine kinase n=1 Tax=Alkalihalobacillus trypoxylicola TaxID=519424 RepID=A0A162DHB7_9BACI|nr:histidine kinase [Alkalihalobacillus trypoxylicola]KYG29635.1 hypothetical protein AZF04_08990 [Alkalihalobacillus trypoxylicola]